MARRKIEEKLKLLPSDAEIEWIHGRNTEIKKVFSDLFVLQEKLDEYFAECKSGGIPPTIEGIALKLKVTERTLYKYMRKGHETISEEYKEAISIILEEAYLKIKNYRVTQISTNSSNRNVEGNKFLLKNMNDNNEGKVYQDKVVNENHEFTINVGLEDEENEDDIKD